MLSVFFLLTMLGCDKSIDVAEQCLSIDEENSFFTDCEVKNGKVYLYCEVSVSNTFEDEKKVSIIGDFRDDEGKLLSESELTAYNAEDSSEIFTVSGESEENFSIVFIGDFAGVNQKHDRLLPKMEIVIVDS